MDGGDLVAILELDEIAVTHTVVVDSLACTQDVIFFVLEGIGYLQVAFLAVEFDGDGIEIVVVFLRRDLDVHGMPVQHGPVTLEIVFEYAGIPIRIDIGIAAEIKKDILLGIHGNQIAMDRGKQVHLFLCQRDKGISVIVNVHRKILKVGQFEQFIRLGKNWLQDG